MSTTLILGCGYLGQRVAQRLRERGTRVLGTTRSAQNAQRLSQAGVEPLVLDLTNPHALTRLPAVEQAVFCAGFDRASGTSREVVWIEGLSRVLRRLSELEVHRIVITSSTSVYGRTDGGWVSEQSPTEPVSESGRVQLAGERVALASGLHVLVLRLAGLYGPGRIIYRESLARGLPLRADPERWLNLIHVDDAARAVCAALECRGDSAIVNVCDDEPTTRGDYARRLARLLGLPEPQWNQEDPPGDLEPNRRVRSERMRPLLLANLEYPTSAHGLAAALRAEQSDTGASSQSTGAGSM